MAFLERVHDAGHHVRNLCRALGRSGMGFSKLFCGTAPGKVHHAAAFDNRPAQTHTRLKCQAASFFPAVRWAAYCPFPDIGNRPERHR